jgi:hypothetical protein
MKRISTLIRYFAAALAIVLLTMPGSAQAWDNIQPMDTLPVKAPWRSRDGALDMSQIIPDPQQPGNNLLYMNDYTYNLRGSFRYDWRLNVEEPFNVPPNEANEFEGITMVFRAKPNSETIKYMEEYPDSSIWWWYVSIRQSGVNFYHAEMRATKDTFELVGCKDQVNPFLPYPNGKSLKFGIDTNWHTYRVTLIQRDVKIYMDENPEPLIDTLVTCVDEGGNQLRVGKQDRNTPYGCLFDYFLILEGAIYAPGEGPAIPEGFVVGPGEPAIVRQLKKAARLSVFPNPAGETMTVSFIQDRSGTATVDIYSLTGQKLMTPYRDYVLAGNHEVNVKTGGLATGIYLLSVNGEYTRFVKR